MLYNLYKKIYALSFENKKYLLNNFDDIVKTLNSDDLGIKKEALKKEAYSGSCHDPETPDEMLKLLDLLEKFVRMDSNISYDNLSVFLHPLMYSSRKNSIKPCKVVGLIRKLYSLSKILNQKNMNMIDVHDNKINFMNTLKETKNKIRDFKR